MRGARGISMEYVIRNENNTALPPVDVPEPDVDSSDTIANRTTIDGLEFDCNSAKVFTALRTILTGTPG